MLPTSTGKYEASSSSATRVYIDLDYPEVTKYQTYEWGTPALQQRLPTTLQKTPLESAAKLHNIQEILQLPNESFEVHIPLNNPLLKGLIFLDI
jgi:hypothetical protein